MLEKIKLYKEWVVIGFLFIGWVGTIAGWISTAKYDRRIREDMVKQLEQMNKNWTEQFEFNGKVKMYIELDSK